MGGPGDRRRSELDLPLGDWGVQTSKTIGLAIGGVLSTRRVLSAAMPRGYFLQRHRLTFKEAVFKQLAASIFVFVYSNCLSLHSGNRSSTNQNRVVRTIELRAHYLFVAYSMS